MNILMITENDPAGMGIAFRNAIVRHTHHHCRLITTTTKYNFDFEKDLHVPDLTSEGFDEIRDLLISADIIHFHVLADENLKLGPISLRDYVRGKTVVHHHHGHPYFRAHPEVFREKYRRLKRKSLVATPDLWKLLPEAHWQPNLVPVDDPLYRPQPLSTNGLVVIGQSVTRKDLKNTSDLLEVIGRMQETGTGRDVRADIIENADHKECLRRKNRCHIVFDHMQGYYGVSSLESLSQGKPVIAGLDDWNIQCIKDFAGADELPWVIARNREELEAELDTLIEDGFLRDQIGRESRSFMEKHWTAHKVSKALLAIYESL